MQRSNNRRRAYRRRQKMRRLIIALAAVAALAAIIAIIVASIPEGTDKPRAVKTTQSPEPTATVEATSSPSPTPTTAPSPSPNIPYAANAQYRPYARDGWLPVFSKADTQEKMIAITIEDCDDAEILRTIVQGAIENGAKLTLFPTGKNVIKDEQAQILSWAWQNGMELENHTYNHNPLYNVDADRLAKEVYVQNLAISKILGVEYQCHFLRPSAAEAKDDQRTHAYAEQLGYYGIAHWSVSGTDTKMADLPDALKPGAVYVFQTTQDDLKKLARFIPYAAQQGYRMVTLNEMFGYPANETRPLTKDVTEYTVPELQPYDVKTIAYRQGVYAYGVMEIQQQLISLGYLEGQPDGMFGPGCASAVRRFQQDNGLTATGEADEETQTKLKAAYTAKLSQLGV